ncbi:alpha/beta hydrolase [Shouchella shacheensis]|uniref:alpha/beta hydrolase n=1 Tax=Shouchella shacheensis TaxID=1649580 RepID=UPI00073FD38A|nr:alpha/beta hydrolase [Shouchella shacheensis]
MKRRYSLGILSATLAATTLAVGTGLIYHKAMVRKDESSESETRRRNELAHRFPSSATDWFAKHTKMSWHVRSKDGLPLHATFLYNEASRTGKTAMLCHDHAGIGPHLFTFARLFYDLGYHVLLPDARGYGKSGGDYSGFGWPDRLDVLSWLDEIKARVDDQSEVVLFGISMGAAAVMSAAGEKALPQNVKAIIEDCGFTSLHELFTNLLPTSYNVPAFPFVSLTSTVVKTKHGYSFKQASPLNQLANNTIPVLFIHGKKDPIVPYTMVESLKAATKGPQEEFAVATATHRMSYAKDPDGYERAVRLFLEKYVG